MRKKGEKIPEDHIYCSKCTRPYGFIRCRITTANPKRNICLGCAVEEERDKLKKQGGEPVDAGGS